MPVNVNGSIIYYLSAVEIQPQPHAKLLLFPDMISSSQLLFAIATLYPMFSGHSAADSTLYVQFPSVK